ncbi:MAG: V-type ATP synthase subunit I [Spirochaetes bacterium]|nr:V-type ATP synthase subunit I [Spirochaetota bacterium]
MIVKMKKTSLVVLDSDVEESMERLRDAGIMHLDLTGDENERISALLEKKSILEKAVSVLPESEKSDKKLSGNDLEHNLELAHKIQDLITRQSACKDEISQLDRDINKILPWGDFSFSEIDTLKEKGLTIKLLELNDDQFNNLPDNLDTFVINRTKVLIRTAVVLTKKIEADNIPYDEVLLPAQSLTELQQQLKNKTAERESIKKELEKLKIYKKDFEHAIEEIDTYLEFEYAVNTMTSEGKVSYLTGFIPERETGKIKSLASKNGWGLMITDPAEDDNIPTLVENPKWVKAISPVFNLLGTIPGYKEFDISIWFLVFFSFFWAMIIGDAGYGLLFLIFTIIGRLKFRKASFEPFLLLSITSIATIIWGAITGTWFGVESFAQHKALSWMVIPAISSFAPADAGADKVIMNLCFIIGTVHLSVAHLLNFIRLLPSLKAVAEIGRLSFIWSLFMLIRNLVLKIEMPSFAIWMLAGGLALVILFCEQNGNFIKGIKDGFSSLILIAINSVSFFSDVVSYVRLFAVGLATVEVAKSFNAMAASLGSGVAAVIGSALILFFGHGLNIILGCMSLIVHGVRLNMLEFSGHLSMEWSGFAFKPFKKRQIAEE